MALVRLPVALPPDVAEIFPVELVLNPHGFLKAAALAGANPKAVWRWELGEMGRDGPEVSPERMRVDLDHLGQVSRGRDDQQGEPAAAHSHVGPE